MNITVDNYERYFYRYKEQELSAQERAEVEAFAAMHPELAEELALYDAGLKVELPKMVYDHKESLKHQSSMSLWRWSAAACVAGLLVGGLFLFRPSVSVEPAAPMVAMVHEPLLEVEDTTAAPLLQNMASPKCHHCVTTAQVEAQQVVEDLPAMVEELLEPAIAMEDDNCLAQMAQEAAQEDTTVVIYIDVPVFAEQDQLADAGELTSIGEYYECVLRMCADWVRASRLRASAQLRTYLAENINI